MPQFDVWEKEYRNPRLISNSDEPQLDFKVFIKWLRKEQHVDLTGQRVLDLGSGNGKNSVFLAERGGLVTGIELSKTAVKLAKAKAKQKSLDIDFLEGDIASKFPVKNNSIDFIIDVVSSNSLSDSERNIYLAECSRVIKPKGFMFVKALCKDGDKNAINLIKEFPGPEADTYKMPGTGLVEKVFSETEIKNLYSKHFKILKSERKFSYTKFEGKSYKRYFWLLYLQK